MELTNQEYWHCVIGPIDSKLLIPNGADSPMRMAVARAFEKIPGIPTDEEGYPTYILSSGWGLTEDQWNAMRDACNATPSNLERVVKSRSI